MSIFWKALSCRGVASPCCVHLVVSVVSRSTIFDFSIRSLSDLLYFSTFAGDVDVSVRCWGDVRSLLWDCSTFWHKSMTRHRWSPGRLSCQDKMLADIVASMKKYVPNMWSILCLPFLNVGGAVECWELGSCRSNRSHSYIKSCSSESTCLIILKVFMLQQACETELVLWS